jgi:cell fate regulator YaaT (PSP1 superfamily)
MIRIVTVKFRTAGKHYDFAAGDLDLHPGDGIIVETDRGRALGRVVYAPREIRPEKAPENLKQVIRQATAEDLELAADSEAREEEAFRFCRERIVGRKMEMKLVKAEYLFDASKIIFFFTADGRVDFRDLVKDLAHHFHTRIEMRQIGVRDEAKLTGGIGVCGRELCCCTFLTSFAPVSVKMAKEQDLALNPNKISGQCGRLLCCLNYEYETYRDMKKCLPKCGRKVQVEDQTGEVVGQNVLAQTVTVKLPDSRSIEIDPDDLTAVQEPGDQSKPAPKPAPKPATKQRARKTTARSHPDARKPRDDSEQKTASSLGDKPESVSGAPAEGGQAETPSRKKPRRRSRGKGRSQQKSPSGDKNG